MTTTDAAPARPPEQPVAPAPPAQVPPVRQHRARRRIVLWIVIAVALLIALLMGIPWLHEVLTTVSTDDAYVNGHVTLVAPRVSGQVARVLVDDNNRVRRGDVLVQLDREPFQVQVSVAQSAVDAARSDLVAA